MFDPNVVSPTTVAYGESTRNIGGPRVGRGAFPPRGDPALRGRPALVANNRVCWVRIQGRHGDLPLHGVVADASLNLPNAAWDG